MAWPPNAAEVDAIEQHPERGGVEPDELRVIGNAGQSKAAALESLVVQHEPAPVEEQDLAPVAPSADEDEQVATVQVELPLVAHDRSETIVAAP